MWQSFCPKKTNIFFLPIERNLRSSFSAMFFTSSLPLKGVPYFVCMISDPTWSTPAAWILAFPPTEDEPDRLKLTTRHGQAVRVNGSPGFDSNQFWTIMPRCLIFGTNLESEVQRPRQVALAVTMLQYLLTWQVSMID